MPQATEFILHIFSTSVARYFILAGIPFIICYQLCPNHFKWSKIQWRRAPKKDFIRDILHSMQTSAVFAVISFLVLCTPFKNITRVYPNLADRPLWWIAASVIISLVIHDTYFYWMHRLLHHPRVFRHAHLLHHQSTNPSPWTSYSFHFIEAWTEGAVLLVIVLLVPVHPIAILLFTIVAFLINVYGHLGYEIAPKWLRKSVLFEFFNTSTHHNLHHSKFKGNYGLYFRAWDRLMGTEHPDYVREFDRVQYNRTSKAKGRRRQNPISSFTKSAPLTVSRTTTNTYT